MHAYAIGMRDRYQDRKTRARTSHTVRKSELCFTQHVLCTFHVRESELCPTCDTWRVQTHAYRHGRRARPISSFTCFLHAQSHHSRWFRTLMPSENNSTERSMASRQITNLKFMQIVCSPCWERKIWRGWLCREGHLVWVIVQAGRFSQTRRGR